jgi:hypothetical protein
MKKRGLTVAFLDVDHGHCSSCSDAALMLAQTSPGASQDFPLAGVRGWRKESWCP